MVRKREGDRNLWCRPGRLVEVRSLEEILETLDANGSLDGLAFMPEMATYAGRRFRVARTAAAICVEGFPGLRKLEDAVFLENGRCDGSAHDGCQRACRIFWKVQWLKPSASSDELTVDDTQVEDVALSKIPTRIGDRYICQSTTLASATDPIRRRSLGPLVEDLRRREVSPARFVRIVMLATLDMLVGFLRGKGLVPSGTQRRTSKGSLNLEPGELVRVKSAGEIEETLTPEGTNRGLSFEYEMLGLCGSVCEVAYPVTRIILETSGEMVELTNSVVLQDQACTGLRRRNCPRANYFFWREAWLERADGDQRPRRAGS